MCTKVFRQPENFIKPRGQQVAHPTKAQQRRRVGLLTHRKGRTQYNGRILFSGSLKGVAFFVIMKKIHIYIYISITYASNFWFFK
ncbi:MAG: hypothetical protein IKZ88_10375 [Neisseriaceae bacterium]|nr:hypothetical protein [Neisseriaceae bacterium]